MTVGRCALSHKVEIPKEYLERVYVEERKSTYVIAAAFRCSVPTVVARLKEHGFVVRGHVSKQEKAEVKRRPIPRGSDHWNWKGGSGRRNDARIKDWRNAVFHRDDYTCQNCGERGGKLNAHHVKKWSDFPDLRYDTDNGQTLCEACHRKTHNWGNRKYFVNEEIGMVP